MNAPPPMPELAGFTSPRHNAVVTAASIALPFISLMIETPILEHL
jgi:hypothetical protein